MAIPASKALFYRFGPFELNSAEGTLSRAGHRVKLQDLPCRLLQLLLEHPGEIVTRDEVRQRLWPENTFVEFDNSLGVAVRKLREALRDDAETPRFVETVPRRGYRFLAPVTVHDPNTHDPSTVATAPQANLGATTAEQKTTKTVPVRGRFWATAALIVLFAGSAIYAARFFLRRSSSTAEARPTQPSVHVRRSVAVLGFRNLPGRHEDNWMSAAFSEMLSTELAAGGELRLISGEDVARARSDLPLQDVDSLAKSTLQRLRTDPGADVVILGSYTPIVDHGTNRIRLDIRLQDTAAGETIAEESVSGSQEDLFQLASQAGIRLRQDLGANSLSQQATAAVRASLPSNQQAVQFYTEGLARLRAFDFIGARDLLLKATVADPNYPLAHSALSEALEHLGYRAKALAEAQRALELSKNLSQEERLLIEGQFRQTIDDFPRAVEAYQSLFNLFPDSLDYGLRLASAQRRVKPADALKTLDMLRHLPPPEGDDPRIDMTEASAWLYQDFAKAHAAAERALAKGNAQGSPLLVARAYGIICQQTGAGTSSTEAANACENARQSYAAAGDHNNEARTLNDFAVLYYQQGDLARAEAMWREAAREFRLVGDIEGMAASANNLGDAYIMQGNLDEAKKFLEQSVPNYQAIEDKFGMALVLNDLADLSREKGDLEGALATYQKAKAMATESNSGNATAYVLTGVGDVHTDQGDLAAARKSYEESLALRNQNGEKQTAAETKVALAQLSIEEGYAADAETVARDCIRQFHDEQQADDELTATGVLIKALLAQGKRVDAQKENDAARSLTAKSQNMLVRLQFSVASARVALASKHPESAQRLLKQTLRDAHGHGFVGAELDARLALAELARKTGHPSAAKEQLSSLEKNARAKGFGLIARKAAAARA
jgi:eukaryotic-like serine/threonine-protein kinase